jgi:tyrosyl-tRNA synthetase
MRITDFLFNSKVVMSKTEARMLIETNALKIDGVEVKKDEELDLNSFKEMKIGKRTTITNEGVVTKKP